MDERKKALVEQIKLLAERSKKADDETLLGLTAQIISLCQLLQSPPCAAKTWHPFYGWMTEKDLNLLKIEREENARRLDEDRKKLGVQVIR